MKVIGTRPQDQQLIAGTVYTMAIQVNATFEPVLPGVRPNLRAAAVPAAGRSAYNGANVKWIGREKPKVSLQFLALQKSVSVARWRRVLSARKHPNRIGGTDIVPGNILAWLGILATLVVAIIGALDAREIRRLNELTLRGLAANNLIDVERDAKGRIIDIAFRLRANAVANTQAGGGLTTNPKTPPA